MSLKNQIILNNLSYTNLKVHLKDINLSLGNQKIGFVGKNGVGKTTLLKLIVGELTPDSGSVQKTCSIAYCPQLMSFESTDTIVQFLGYEDKLNALERIIKGSVDEHDFEILNDDWSIKDRILEELSSFNLERLSLTSKLEDLSGGEKTRLLLTKTFLSDADFIILDEPTNNLDLRAREALYKRIERSKRGFLIVSHDRTLLNLMDQIIELTTKGIQVFGGNYEHYVEQKEIINKALEQQLQDAKKEIKKVERSIQKSREKHEQSQSKGMAERKKGGQLKSYFDMREDRSQRTQGTLSTKAIKMSEDAQNKLSEIKEKIEIKEIFDLDLKATYVPSHKMVLDIENLSFGYDKSRNIIDKFNLKIHGPERVAIIGDNGSGKTTLLRLISGDLKPSSGTIKIGVDRISYLDQKASILDPNLSLVDNFIKLNPDSNLQYAYTILAQFLFRNVNAQKLVCNLSGGEKIRAALACILMSSNPPKLLILDEPVNYLDLDSIRAIEGALSGYKGAILVVSHDQKFLENIKIDRFVEITD